MQAQAAITQRPAGAASEAVGIATCSRNVAAGLLASSAPCALLDEAGNIVEASATLGSIVATPNGRPASEVFLVDQAEVVARPLPPRDIHGVYACSNGELVPLMLRPLYVVDGTPGSALFLIIDGAPFRGAEIERFKLTPYALMRVRNDGIVRYANEAAVEFFAPAPADDMAGKQLTALFEPRAASKIRAQFARCVAGKAATPLEVSVAARAGLPPEAVRLSLMPDPAPDKRTLGVIAVVRSVAIEKARDEIRRIAIDPTMHHWEERLGKIVDQVKSVMYFDQATFGVYAEDVTLFRAMFLKPKDMVIWPKRWMELPPSIKDNFLASGKTWVADIREFVKSEPSLAKDEVVQRYLGHGINSSVTLPIRGRDEWSCAFSLCSRVPNQYGERDLARLRELELEPVLLRIESDIKASRDGLWHVFKEEIATAESLRTAGKNIVDQVAFHFKWDHASLFRVNRHDAQFEMVYQVGATPEYEFKAGYTQPIENGMLASTLREDRVLIVDDVNAQGALHGYEPVNKCFRAAMTVPVHLNGRVRWILNAESAVTHAFMGPDKKGIERFVKVMEEGLERRMLKEVKVRLLEEMQQGLVMVGLEGAILEMNGMAARLLGRPGSDIDKRQLEHAILAKYAADPDAGDRLAGLLPTAGQRIELKGEDGRVRAVMATRRDLDDSFDTALWFLTDLENQEWTRDLSFLRETAADVAQQTRGPLALASTLTQQVPLLWKRLQDSADPLLPAVGALEKLCQRVVAEVGKADMTFERLAEGLAITKAPVRECKELDLRHCVREVVSLFPARDRKRVVQNMPNGPLTVSGDVGRLSFVVRSILGHLLRSLPSDDAQIEIDAHGRDDRGASLVLRVTGQEAVAVETAAKPRDAVWEVTRAAREDASLALTAVTKVIEAHGGELSKLPSERSPGDLAPPWIAFRIDLPQSPGVRAT